MLRDIKWFYEKGNILEASKCLESAESMFTGFLDSAETSPCSLQWVVTQNAPQHLASELPLSGAKLLVPAVVV